jgi:hypothetical protein
MARRAIKESKEGVVVPVEALSDDRTTLRDDLPIVQRMQVCLSVVVVDWLARLFR